jgi:hypothetical protein
MAHWVIAYFRQFFENCRSRRHFRATFFYGYGLALILAKMALAIFWVIFSLTHLVTLVGLTRFRLLLDKSSHKKFTSAEVDEI